MARLAFRQSSKKLKCKMFTQAHAATDPGEEDAGPTGRHEWAICCKWYSDRSSRDVNNRVLTEEKQAVD